MTREPIGRGARTARSEPQAGAIARHRRQPPRAKARHVAKLLDQLDAIEDQGGNGVLELPGGDRLEVSNLGKVFWPKLKLTKGDLFRHYVRVAPYILPVLADRPLVMKRYPNGVDGKPFYQHRAPDKIPPGVRVEEVDDRHRTRAAPHRRIAR